MKPKLIIFRLGRHACRHHQPHHPHLSAKLADCGLPVPEADQIRPLIGYSLSGIIRRLTHNVSEHVQKP